MAHSCPECDSYCTCGGDIDDMQLDGTAEQIRCTCCLNRRWDDDDYLDDDDDSDYLCSLYLEEERQRRIYRRRMKGHLRKLRSRKPDRKLFYIIIGGRQRKYYSRKTYSIAYKAGWIDDLPF